MIEKKNNIFIFSPNFDLESGGNSIIHYLHIFINKYSQISNAYLYPYIDSVKKDLSTDLLGKKDFNVTNEIEQKIYDFSFEINYDVDFIIYPESIKGNPLNFKNVIRWILYFPCKDIYETYDDNDILLFYCQPYLRNIYYLSDIEYLHSYIIDNYNDEKHLFLTIINDSLEKNIINNNFNKNGKIYTKRKICGIYNTKQYPDNVIISSHDKTNFIENKKINLENLNEAFNSHNELISYDLYTFLNRLALKANCKSTVIKNPLIHKDDWKYNCFWMNGIKYGENDSEECIYTYHDYEKFNEENIKNLDDIINRRLHLDCTKFTDPLFNLYNINGIEYNNIKMNINLNNISIDVRFKINSFNFDYENLFDLNYGIINCGPRLEINRDGCLALVICRSNNNGYINCNNLNGYIIDNKIELNTYYILKLSFNNDIISYNINNKIGTFKILDYYNLELKNICICGGFDENRRFINGNIYSFKIYNYKIPIYDEYVYKIPNYDYIYNDYPKNICNCIYKYDNLYLHYKLFLSNITVKFTYKNNNNIEILNLNNMIIFTRDNVLRINIYNVIYSICNVEHYKIYDIIISIDMENKLLISTYNNNICKIIINNIQNNIGIDNIKTNIFLSNLSILNYNINNRLLFDYEFNNNINSYKNSFDTFGFLKISNLFIEDNEKLIKIFEYNTYKYSTNIFNYIPQSCENLDLLVNVILNNKINNVLKIIFDSDNYTYTGSDSKIYNIDTNWHCDRITNNVHLKVALYLNKLDKSNGCLRVLPGSHIKSNYNNIIKKNTIPLFLGPGGFNNNFIKINDRDIPSHDIQTNFGDLILFNLGLFHCAFNNNINKKMFCINFSQKYENINDHERLECINTDYNIIGYSVNLDTKNKFLPVNNNFYKYIKLHTNYDKNFRDNIENDNILDYLIRAQLNINGENQEVNNKIIDDFNKDTINTNINKINEV